MSDPETNIEKDAFKAASIAQGRGATAKECLEIGIRHAMKSTEAVLRDEREIAKAAYHQGFSAAGKQLHYDYEIGFKAGYERATKDSSNG